jgi:peptide/nickel transport system permease protein
VSELLVAVEGSVESIVPVEAAARRKRKRPPAGALFGMTFLGLLTFTAVLGDRLWYVRPFDEKVKLGDGIANRYALGPGWDAFFGTDSLGQDVFAKCIYGARTTLVVGVLATMLGLFLGGLIGIVAGYRRGLTDRIIGIGTDSLLSMPAIVLAIVMITKLDVIIADLGENHDINWFDWVDRRWQITLTLGLLAIAPLARIVRAQTLTLREREYVLAARSIGATTTRVLAREILPNLIPTMLTVAFTGLGILIAAEGALAFLGLSVEAPTPTWGKLIDQNRTAMNVGWWATLFPCVMLFLSVLSFNLIGDWMSKRFDIRGAAI